MDRNGIYQTIAERTNGDIYIGIVGPVRTGKSTFIKRFMDLIVLPNIQNEYVKERAIDELPQSGAGRTITTTEPKFIPNEAVAIELNENVSFRVRLVDCVGYLVKGSIGYLENNKPRMVSTPWFDHQIPFEEGATIGTKKVITEHSTIGLVVTTDGSISDIARDEYKDAEEKVISELKELNKPFVVIINSKRPNDINTQKLKEQLSTKHKVEVIAVNALEMTQEDINNIMEKILYEFPVKEIRINFPKWIESLEQKHWLRSNIYSTIKSSFKDVITIRESLASVEKLLTLDFIKKTNCEKINLNDGSVMLRMDVKEELFYNILNEITGLKIDGEHMLIPMMKELSRIKSEYEIVEFALNEVKTKGYGIVMPQISELSLEEPEIIKQGGRFGVKLRASAPSIHMIKADIETEIAPLVGTEKQSEDLVNYLLQEFEGEPDKIWNSNIFGKTLHELVNEGLNNKLYRMPEDAQLKLQETLQKIINEGSGGLICIIL